MAEMDRFRGLEGIGWKGFWVCGIMRGGDTRLRQCGYGALGSGDKRQFSLIVPLVLDFWGFGLC